MNPHTHEKDSENTDFGFTAPEAKVLLVDDLALILKAAENLLKPLKMQIDTALGGKEALNKMSQKHYDIVFMDHMMPEMDGIETAHTIRRFRKEYESVPIIALTANAADGTQDMLLNEGMNDFIAKPLESGAFISKVKKWLPADKIHKTNHPENAAGNQKPDKETAADGADTKPAVKKQCSGKMDILPDKLHEIFARMREAVNNLDADDMEMLIGEMGLYRYEGWQDELFGQLKNAVDELDMDACEEIIHHWEKRL